MALGARVGGLHTYTPAFWNADLAIRSVLAHRPEGSGAPCL